MVFALLRRKEYKKCYADGYAEGRAEADATWHAWLDRMEAAKSAGKPFDEPNPSGQWNRIAEKAKTSIRAPKYKTWLVCGLAERVNSRGKCETMLVIGLAWTPERYGN